MTNNQNQTTAASKKMSNYIMVITIVVMVLAVIAVIVAVSAYYSGSQLVAGFFALVGVAAFVMSAVTLYQARRQASEMKIEIPKVMTTVGCNTSGCDSKTVREFQRGDYVYKDLDTPCPKCAGRQMITAIYKEVKEKEKTYAV